MKNAIAKNYIYNLIYQLSSLLIPLVTAPYLVRALGVEGIGIYSFNYSIAYYFSLVALLGINNHGTRSIARCSGNEGQTDSTFSEIYAFQLVLGVIVCGLYVLYTVAISDAPLLCLCFLPFIIASAIDITWFFYGQERFKIIVFRNTIIKILTTVLIFIIVKEPADVVKYTLIMSLGALLSQITIWCIKIKERDKRQSKKRLYPKDVVKHIKPCFILFIPVIAVSVYRTMDKIMLGNMTSMEQVGYYENAEKIISVLLGVITSLGTVLLPRMAAMYEQNDKSRISSLTEKTLIYVSLAASAITFGVAAVAEKFVVIYYGSNCVQSASILKTLCLSVPFISYANIIRMQYLVPAGKDKAYVLSCMAGACGNFLLNMLFIPLLGGDGAALGTVGAELLVFLVQLFYLKQFKNDLAQASKTIIAVWANGAVMYCVVNLLSNKLPTSILGLCAEVLFGAVVYVVLIILQQRKLKEKNLAFLINYLKKRIMR